MKNYSLHEISKVLAGVALADIITMVWLASQNLLPTHFMGLWMSPEMVLPSVIFTLSLFIVFVHYGWHIGKIPRMREGSYLLIMGAFFALITIAHLWSLLGGGELQIMDFTMPLWLSWIGVGATAYIAYMSFVLMGRIKK